MDVHETHETVHETVRCPLPSWVSGPGFPTGTSAPGKAEEGEREAVELISKHHCTTSEPFRMEGLF
jgi:hypothetical protein